MALRTLAALALFGFALLAAGCSSVYYDAMEAVGKEKRHILTDRVEGGREDQQEAQEQFQTTLEAFKAVTGFDGGDLESTYERLNDEYERSEARAQAVRDRITSIEKVSGDLFSEWKTEIGQISDKGMRRASQEQLWATQRSYEAMVGAMKKASKSMDPVLVAFRDRVLFLKHNLNARAIASLEGDLGSIETDVAKLIEDMNASIAEADSFLASMEG